jgi:hypothetical protein
MQAIQPDSLQGGVALFQLKTALFSDATFDAKTLASAVSMANSFHRADVSADCYGRMTSRIVRYERIEIGVGQSDCTDPDDENARKASVPVFRNYLLPVFRNYLLPVFRNYLLPVFRDSLLTLFRDYRPATVDR